MSAGRAPVYLLPPRPRLRDWPLAGACAGMAFGLAEVGMAHASRTGLPASLAAGLAATDALLVAAVAGLVGGTSWLAGFRPSHSGLVGAVLGAQLFVATGAPLVLRSDAGALARLGLLALVSGGLGLAACRVGDRSERAGVPASGPLVWGATGLLLAGAARLAHDGARAAPGRLLGLGFAALVIAAGTALAHELGRRRGSGSRMRFGRLLALLGAGVGLAALGPALLPWLLFERDLPAPAPGPPNLLVAVLPGTGDGDAGGSAPGVTWASLGGRGYRLASPGERPADPGFPRLPDGRPLARELHARGFATALIARQPVRAADLGPVEVDDRPGARAQLHGSAAWLAAAPLWRGPGAPVLEALGLGGRLRTPAQVAGAARRWLLRWRTSRSAVPFYLRVDLRGPGAGAEEIDAGFGEILDALHELELDAATLVLAAAPPARPQGAGRATLRPPRVWARPVPTGAPARRLDAGELGAALVRVALAPPESPPPLP